jgi:hypothetical protein
VCCVLCVVCCVLCVVCCVLLCVVVCCCLLLLMFLFSSSSSPHMFCSPHACCPSPVRPMWTTLPWHRLHGSNAGARIRSRDFTYIDSFATETANHHARRWVSKCRQCLLAQFRQRDHSRSCFGVKHRRRTVVDRPCSGRVAPCSTVVFFH